MVNRDIERVNICIGFSASSFISDNSGNNNACDTLKRGQRKYNTNIIYKDWIDFIYLIIKEVCLKPLTGVIHEN